MNQDTRDRALGRLRRIAGQIAGIQRMLEGERDCVDVLVQVAAAQAALLETGRVILSGHVEKNLTEALRNRDPRDRRKKVDELTQQLLRFLRIDEVPAIDLDPAIVPKTARKAR